MQALNHLVAQGKVLYLGISDTPAWVVVKANCYARAHGLRPFSVYQGRWSAAERDFERDILPMARDEQMALAPWGALGGGYFRSPDETKSEGRTLGVKTGKEERVSVVLDRVARRKGTLVTSVALAYVLHKGEAFSPPSPFLWMIGYWISLTGLAAPYTFPIIGGRKTQHLQANIEALSLSLSPEDIEEIETGYEFTLGFPHNFLHGMQELMVAGPEDVVFTKRQGTFDHVKGPQPILPQTTEDGK